VQSRPEAYRSAAWEVVIDDTEVLPEADITKLTRTTTAAMFEFPPMRDGTPHIPPAEAG
jgi:hypothetical protein